MAARKKGWKPLALPPRKRKETPAPTAKARPAPQAHESKRKAPPASKQTIEVKRAAPEVPPPPLPPGKPGRFAVEVARSDMVMISYKDGTPMVNTAVDGEITLTFLRPRTSDPG